MGRTQRQRMVIQMISQKAVKAGLSTRQLAKLGKNENVTTDVLVKVCKALNCNVDEIMDILESKDEN